MGMSEDRKRSFKVKNANSKRGSLSSFIEQENSVMGVIDRALSEVKAILDLQRMQDELQDAVGNSDDNDNSEPLEWQHHDENASRIGGHPQRRQDAQSQSDDDEEEDDDWTAGERTMSSYAGTHVSIVSELRGLEQESERLNSHIAQAEAAYKMSQQSAIESLVEEPTTNDSTIEPIRTNAVMLLARAEQLSTSLRSKNEIDDDKEGNGESPVSDDGSTSRFMVARHSTVSDLSQSERWQAAATTLNELSGLLGGLGSIKSSSNNNSHDGQNNIHTIFTIKSDDVDNYTLSDGTLGGVPSTDEDDEHDHHEESEDDGDTDDDDYDDDVSIDNETISDMLSLAESLDTFVTHLSKQQKLASQTVQNCYSATLRFRLATHALACRAYKSTDVHTRLRILPLFLQQQRYREEQEEEQRKSGPRGSNAVMCQTKMMLGVPLFGSASICNGERMVFMTHQPTESLDEEDELEEL